MVKLVLFAVTDSDALGEVGDEVAQAASGQCGERRGAVEDRCPRCVGGDGRGERGYSSENGKGCL
jgi:hypothetical protein